MSAFWWAVKDGLKALLSWIVARMLLVYFFGYSGYLLSQLFGAILLIIFVGRNLVRFRMQLQGAYRRRMQPGPSSRWMDPWSGSWVSANGEFRRQTMPEL